MQGVLLLFFYYWNQVPRFWHTEYIYIYELWISDVMNETILAACKQFKQLHISPKTIQGYQRNAQYQLSYEAFICWEPVICRF